MKKILRPFLVLLLFLGFVASAHAQTMNGAFQVNVGAGAALHSPVRFDLDSSAEYFWNDTYSIGLDFDILARGATAFDFIPFVRYHFDLDRWPRFSPYIGGGMGVKFNTTSQSWFDLMLPELGFSYEWNPHFYIGPNISLHTLAGSNTTWDLQLLAQATYRF